MAAGHGEKLSRKQEAVIAALLSQPTIDRAAAACEVGERTLRRWLKEPAFLTAYRDARRQVVEEAIALLQRLAGVAAATVHRNLTCGKAGVELAAAFGVIDRALKGVEVVDLIAEVEGLRRDLEALRHAADAQARSGPAESPGAGGPANGQPFAAPAAGGPAGDLHARGPGPGPVASNSGVIPFPADASPDRPPGR
jgi:hypothetical protein